MSATIDELKFVIFGSGHDYTLNNSGSGVIEFRFFAHPKAPLGSTLHMEQYFFLVPDPFASPLDLTVDDYDAVLNMDSDCTFEPAIGTVLNTLGEKTIKVSFKHDYYNYDTGTTTTIERTYYQTIEVVNHGAVVSHESGADLYEDGYLFMYSDIPLPVGGATKVSAIPWRIYSLNFEGFVDLQDLTELRLSDTTLLQSSCHDYEHLNIRFADCTSLESLNGLEDYDVNDWDYVEVFENCTSLTDISALAGWDMTGITSVWSMFQNCTSLSDLTGLENWDVSQIDTFQEMFHGCSSLSDLTPLENWRVGGNVNNANCAWMFVGCNLLSLDGLNGWKPATLQYFVENNSKLTDISALASFNMSVCKSISGAFYGCTWLQDISPLAIWDVSAVTNMSETFAENARITSIPLPNWNVYAVTTFRGMFDTRRVYYSSALNKDVVNRIGSEGYEDRDGNVYTEDQVGTLTERYKDASGISDWNISLAHGYAFNYYTEWHNIPSWN